MNRLAFDIEVEGRDKVDVDRFKPTFEAPGNIKDPAKIAQAIADKEANWYDKLALSALTGRVLVIGVKAISTNQNYKGANTIYLEGDEKKVISDFWEIFRYTSDLTLFGHYVYTYDMPMLIRRSWALSVLVPSQLDHGDKRSWRRDGIFDTADMWALGGRQPEDSFISLDHLAKLLGIGSKAEDGKNFAAWYHKERKAALNYLDNDLYLAGGIAAKLVGFEADKLERHYIQ